MYGPLAAFVSEMFGTSARYTGASLGYQLATTLGAGLAPLGAASLLALGDGNPVWVSVMVAGISLVSAVAIYFTRESYRNDLDDAPHPRGAPHRRRRAGEKRCFRRAPRAREALRGGAVRLWSEPKDGRLSGSGPLWGD